MILFALIQEALTWKMAVFTKGSKGDLNEDKWEVTQDAIRLCLY